MKGPDRRGCAIRSLTQPEQLGGRVNLDERHAGSIAATYSA
jgi:hypothetical protein